MIFNFKCLHTVGRHKMCIKSMYIEKYMEGIMEDIMEYIQGGYYGIVG